MTAEGYEPLPFDWAALVPRVVHPARVAIIEAMRWIDRPISATEMVQMIEEAVSVSFMAYHFRVLASRKIEAIEKVDQRYVRGAEEKYFQLRDVPPVG
ncbi:MAG: hypothetical protein ACOYD4_08580 [Solirubrobacterales bacterium]